MFHIVKYEDRLACWAEFRRDLESSQNPIQDVVGFYSQAPQVSINTDPWDRDTWPTPWELIHENQYCQCCKLLGICYTLQLSEQFTWDRIEIYIGTDSKRSRTLYLLRLDDLVLDAENNSVNNTKEIMHQVNIEKIYTMQNIK